VGITLFDSADGADDCAPNAFDINFWHWRAIVEAIRRLDILPEERVSALHEPFCANGLNKKEAGTVAAALRERVIATLAPDERLLLDGRRTTEPDDLVFHSKPEDGHKNYSTDRDMLTRFAAFCEACNGFEVC
jgi:hypothetical protein